MTLNELVRLDEKFGIPEELRDNFQRRHGEDPIGAARAHIKKKRAERIALIAFFLFSLVLYVGFLISVRFDLVVSSIVGLLIIAFGALAVKGPGTIVPHESETVVGEFASNVGRLKNWVRERGFNPPLCPGIWVAGFAEGDLVGLAHLIQMLERDLEKTRSIFDHSISRQQKERGAEMQVSKYRDKFSLRHRVYRDLGLVEPDWDKFFKLAKQRRLGD